LPPIQAGGHRVVLREVVHVWNFVEFPLFRRLHHLEFLGELPHLKSGKLTKFQTCTTFGTENIFANNLPLWKMLCPSLWWYNNSSILLLVTFKPHEN
jgi:hypothetical protein